MPSTWLLVTDVDDTLLGDDQALRRFVSATSEAPLTVVLNSSRPIASVTAGLVDVDPLPAISGIIGALGTEIELDGERLSTWSTQFADFDRRRIEAAMITLDAVLHSEEYQTPLKASFAIAGERWGEATVAANNVGFPVRVITSGESSVDVIPGAAGKAAAVRHVASTLGVPPERVMTAGDSENDADMLAAANGIMVGNATDGLRAMLTGSAYSAGASHADGIVEGLRHYGVPVGEATAGG